ncbi:MAG: acyl-CoA dehydrogenase family protein, partial [Erythrobacter sp.]|nr:acyl-CoA dehydrogenase family protein [Erythrobacter sp.]
DEAIAALCAEACGAMKVAHAMTVEYSRQRKQFGVAIGSFQVLQHRMVDMYTAYEQSVSLTYLATLRLDAPDAERKRAVSAAKVGVGQAARLIGQDAVQIHGGNGVTDEYAIGHYFKRLTIFDSEFGNVDHHMKRHIALA